MSSEAKGYYFVALCFLTNSTTGRAADVRLKIVAKEKERDEMAAELKKLGKSVLEIASWEPILIADKLLVAMHAELERHEASESPG